MLMNSSIMMRKTKVKCQIKCSLAIYVLFVKFSNVEGGCPWQPQLLYFVLLSSWYYTELQRNVNETWSKDQKIFILKITKYCVNISSVNCDSFE